VKKSASSISSTPTPALPKQESIDPPPVAQDAAIDIPGLDTLTKVEDSTIGKSEDTPMLDVDQTSNVEESPRRLKRTLDDVAKEDANIDAEETLGIDTPADEDDDDAPADANKAEPLALKVNADGTVEQEDTVKCGFMPIISAPH
jgi:hypothetical protein